MKKLLKSVAALAMTAAICTACASGVKPNEVFSVADLDGKTIGVQLGTTGDIYSSDIADATIDRYKTGAEAVMALKQGKVDAVIIDNEPAKVFVEKNEDLTILEEEFAIEEYAIAIKKGNTELTEAINGALAELKSEGTLELIQKNWIGDEAGQYPYVTPEGTEYPNGKLVMATNAAFPPYEFKEGDNFAGIDVEIPGKIAEKLGMTLEIQDVEFGSIIGGVQTGKFDIGMAGMTVTDERLESVNFSKSYATGIQVVIVNEDSAIASLDDLKGDGSMKFGVQQDTTGDIYASDTAEKGGYGEENVIRYKTGAEAVMALKAGKVDAVIIDNEPAKSFVAANEGLKILEGNWVLEDYAIAVAKENTALLTAIDNALAELTADGTVADIIAKYIPAEEAADETTEAADETTEAAEETTEEAAEETTEAAA